MADCPEQWKLDVNDRYHHAVGVVTSLSTGAIVVPIVFLRDVAGRSAHSLASDLNVWAYLAWSLLALAIIGAVVYYYSSAKWVKLAWNRPADMFGKPVQPPFVETVLDCSYFVMMTGFVLGLLAMVVFMVGAQHAG